VNVFDASGSRTPGVRDTARVWIILCAIALAGSLFLFLGMPTFPHRAVGGVGIVFFGLAINTLSRRARLRAPKWDSSAFGVSVEGSPFGVIEWRDVERAYLWRRPTAELLCLCVRDPTKYRERLSTAAAIDAAFAPNLGRRTLVIDVSCADTRALLAAIEARVGHRR